MSHRLARLPAGVLRQRPCTPQGPGTVPHRQAGGSLVHLGAARLAAAGRAAPGVTAATTRDGEPCLRRSRPGQPVHRPPGSLAHSGKGYGGRRAMVPEKLSSVRFSILRDRVRLISRWLMVRTPGSSTPCTRVRASRATDLRAGHVTFEVPGILWRLRFRWHRRCWTACARARKSLRTPSPL